MELSSEVLKMRNALLERIGDKPLKEVAQIVNEILLNETNSINRLAALSARVKVLRDYINQNYNLKKYSDKKNKFNEVKVDPKTNIKETEIDDVNQTEKTEGWVRVEMLKSGVVNGVRFPQGVIIDVSNTDAKKLVSDNLSRIIEIQDNDNKKVSDETKEENKIEDVPSSQTETKEENKIEDVPSSQTETKEENKIEDVPSSQIETKEQSKTKNTENNDLENIVIDKKILKKKSTKITEETIELTDPKAVAEALGLNEKKKKEEEPEEIEEEIDIEALETGK